MLQTAGGEKLSRPVASIVIKQATHFLARGAAYTRGEFQVVEVFKDKNIHFESYARVVKKRKAANGNLKRRFKH